MGKTYNCRQTSRLRSKEVGACGMRSVPVASPGAGSWAAAGGEVRPVGAAKDWEVAHAFIASSVCASHFLKSPSSFASTSFLDMS